MISPMGSSWRLSRVELTDKHRAGQYGYLTGRQFIEEGHLIYEVELTPSNSYGFDRYTGASPSTFRRLPRA